MNSFHICRLLSSIHAWHIHNQNAFLVASHCNRSFAATQVLFLQHQRPTTVIVANVLVHPDCSRTALDTLSPAWIAIDRTFVRSGSFIVVLKVYEAFATDCCECDRFFVSFEWLLSSIVALFIPALVSTAIEPLCVRKLYSGIRSLRSIATDCCECDRFFVNFGSTWPALAVTGSCNAVLLLRL